MCISPAVSDGVSQNSTTKSSCTSGASSKNNVSIVCFDVDDNYKAVHTMHQYGCRDKLFSPINTRHNRNPLLM